MVPPAPIIQPRPITCSVAGNTEMSTIRGFLPQNHQLPANASVTDSGSVPITDLTNVEQPDSDPISAPESTNPTSQLPLSSLDPTLPPSSPRPGPSLDNRPSQPAVGKGKSKPKTGIATTKEEVALEFSRIDVNTIRARLKTLETKNKDLET